MFLGHLLGRLEFLLASLGDGTARSLWGLHLYLRLHLPLPQEQVRVQLGEASVAETHHRATVLITHKTNPSLHGFLDRNLLCITLRYHTITIVFSMRGSLFILYYLYNLYRK